MKEPQIQIRRRQKDPLPVLILFGVEYTQDGLQAEAHHIVSKVRAGTVLKHGSARYRLPAMTPGFHLTPLSLNHV